MPSVLFFKVVPVPLMQNGRTRTDNFLFRRRYSIHLSYVLPRFPDLSAAKTGTSKFVKLPISVLFICGPIDRCLICTTLRDRNASVMQLVSAGIEPATFRMSHFCLFPATHRHQIEKGIGPCGRNTGRSTIGANWLTHEGKHKWKTHSHLLAR